MVFVCHLTLQDYVIKALYDFMFGAPQSKLPPYKFGGHIYCDSGEVKIISQAHVMKQ